MVGIEEVFTSICLDEKTQESVNIHRLEIRKKLLIIRKIGFWKGVLITIGETKVELSRSTKGVIQCGMVC